MYRSAFIALLVVVVAVYAGETEETEESVEDCPGGPNDHFTECGSNCEPSCDNPAPEFCTFQCAVNVCRCTPGYLRRRDQECVLEQDCDTY